MTISDKIRIYELSRDLNLENKDILDAAQKLSISAKNHSSSISLIDAKKIKNHLGNSNKNGKNILSVSKSSKKDESNKSINKSAEPNIDLKQSNNSTKKDPIIPPQIISTKSQKPKEDISTNKTLKNEFKSTSKNPLPPTKVNQPPKTPRPKIELIEKPINVNRLTQAQSTNKTNNIHGQKLNKNNTNSIKRNTPLSSETKDIRPNKPELVGAPIRKESPKINKPSTDKNGDFKQIKNTSFTSTSRSGSVNRPITPNTRGGPNRPNFNRQEATNRQGGGNPSRQFGSQSRQGAPNRPGSPNRPSNLNRQGAPNRPGGQGKRADFNKNNPRFNKQNTPGVRKPVSSNELMQLQKTHSSKDDKPNKVDSLQQKKPDTNKLKPKAPSNRPGSIQPSKKTPHRSTNSSKRSGRTDWDDSAKLEALRNKSPQKQRQKVHIIGENDDSLTTETSGYAGDQKTSILSASLARPKKEKAENDKKSKSSRQFKKKKKETTRQRQKRRAMELKASREAKQVRPEMIIVPEDNLTVQELADKLRLESSEIIKSLFFKGITATVTQSLDLATIETVAEEFGVPVLQDDIEEAAKKTVDMIESTDMNSLINRPPVVTVMGHVDHGKTSLLDSIRKARVASGEAGGITQHIGAYQVEVKHETKNKKLTFLDTPGHEAFTAMRARGTKVTDVAVLVVAADDGVRPQTLEAISHARAAKVPIVVAINKIDKEGASPDRVKQELSEKDLIAEDWGGDVVMVPVSAIKGQNIDKLLEMILLVSEVEDLQANPDRLAKGTVIEAHLDKAKGPVATLLIQNGTLKSGDVLAAGSVLGRIRAMVDEHGNRIKEAAPSFPVEALGFSEVPTAGDEFEVYPDEKIARSIVGERATDARATKLAQQMASRRVSLSSLSNQANEGELKELNLILKADVQGSVEAILGSLEQLPKNEVQVRVLLSAPGEITETDIDLAAASGSVIIGFNTSLASGAKRSAEANDVDIREYEVIYKLLEDIQSAMEGLLEPDLIEESLGEAQVRAIFAVGKGSIAGCYITTGKLQRNCSVRVRRENQIVFEGNLDSLKRTKDDVKEVNTGFECGVGCDKFSSWNEGDIIEAYKLVTKKRTLSK